MSTKNDVRNSESILIVEPIDYGYCILRELRKTFVTKQVAFQISLLSGKIILFL